VKNRSRISRMIGVALVAGGLAFSQAVGVASAQQIMLPPPPAIDGATFSMQPISVQNLFRATFGAEAPVRWIAEHNLELLNGTFVDITEGNIAVAGVQVSQLQAENLGKASNIAAPDDGDPYMDPGLNH
jgi:hypothetical protein